jgi:hypothetical protein
MLVVVLMMILLPVSTATWCGLRKEESEKEQEEQLQRRRWLVMSGVTSLPVLALSLAANRTAVVEGLEERLYAILTTSPASVAPLPPGTVR